MFQRKKDLISQGASPAGSFRFLSRIQIAAILLLVVAIGVMPVRGQNPVRELIPGMDYATWYAGNSGYSPDPNFFGAYVLQPIGDTLYVGFGTARPAESDGAVVGSYTQASGALNFVFQPTEQGIADMAAGEGATLFVAGADPCCPDDWAFGNVYAYTPPGPVIKHRTLPNVIHTWGLWWQNGLLYASTGSHTGDYVTGVGQIFMSVNQGVTWDWLADLGGARVYDVIGWNNRLYAIYNELDLPNEPGDPLKMAQSTDWGDTWVDVIGTPSLYRARMTMFKGKLLTLGINRDSIYALDNVGFVQQIQLPFVVGQYCAYNLMAVANDGYLYTVTNNGRMYRTPDLATWTLCGGTGSPLISVAYWPGRNWLVFGGQGSAAKLWKIEMPANNPPPQIGRNPSMLTATCTQGENAPSQRFKIWNNGGGTLSYTIAETIGWLSCTPASGTCKDELDTVEVNYSTAGVAPGDYYGSIRIVAAGASNSPQTISAVIRVLAPVPAITAFAINNGAISTSSRLVRLNNACTGVPTAYMASQSPTFAGATWKTYVTSPYFTLSAGLGVKTVYLKVRNASGVSPVASDTIRLGAP